MILGVCPCGGELKLRKGFESANGEAVWAFWLKCEACGLKIKGEKVAAI